MPTTVLWPAVTATPSTVAITLARVPTLVIVQVSAITTVNSWSSVSARAVASKPPSVRAVPSYSLLALFAVIVTSLQFTVTLIVSFNVPQLGS